MEPLIQLAPGAEQSGLATMLAKLLRQNLDDHPDKRARVATMAGRVTLIATDLATTAGGGAVTLRFDRGRVEVGAGTVGVPDVVVRTRSETLMQMSLVELGPKGLPDPRGDGTRAMIAATRRGDIEEHGALGHLALVLGLTEVMSVQARAETWDLRGLVTSAPGLVARRAGDLLRGLRAPKRP
ncbi:MAG: SCP2 sterol-binding domain-containing protein [Myxococcales bacterium]|nr:SCP2 sterol-binding domain-containing protein [Myxococcales bacterium]